MTLDKILSGFYNYIKSEKIRGANAIAAVSLQDYNNDNTYISIQLYPIGVAHLAGDSSTFYGYVMKDSFYCFFYSRYKYLQRDSTISNPGFIKHPVISLPKSKRNIKMPKPLYHPYQWEIVFKNDSILEMFPKSTVEKFVDSL
ncbi:MAG: hypothetical protein QM737_18670 [Ferruginibacter sp.]